MKVYLYYLTVCQRLVLLLIYKPTIASIVIDAFTICLKT